MSGKTKKQMAGKRWCFRKDDSCHDYLMPVSEAYEFDTLMDELSNAEDQTLYEVADKIDSKFSKYRCSHPESYTFRDPQ